MSADDISPKELAPGEMGRLKAESQRLKPHLRVGREGVTPDFLKAVDEALGLHGLIKLKFDACKEEKKTLVPQIAEASNARIVLFVGNTVTLHRKRSDASATSSE